MKSIPVRRLASAQTQSSASRFSIRQIQQLLNGSDLLHDLHKHDFYFVLAVIHGKGLHTIDFIEYPIHNNSIFILRPGQVHQLQLSANTTGFLMEFDLSVYQPKNTISENRWKKATTKNYCEVEASNFKRLHTHLSAIFEEYSNKNDGYIEAIRANLDLFFIDYVRQSRDPSSKTTSENNYIQERFEDFIRLLEANVGNMKNASQYAELLNLSSYQLNSITKLSVGKTVSHLINEQIILEAKRNLLATANQIKDVADQLGYENVSYFIRFFKKHTGHSPDAFRKNYK